MRYQRATGARRPIGLMLWHAPTLCIYIYIYILWCLNKTNNLKMRETLKIGGFMFVVLQNHPKQGAVEHRHPHIPSTAKVDRISSGALREGPI